MPRDVLSFILRDLKSHGAFTEWNRKYGEVVGLRVFGKALLVLGSHRAVREILEKRSAISSLRPRLVMVEDMSVL